MNPKCYKSVNFNNSQSLNDSRKQGCDAEGAAALFSGFYRLFG
jgi:hypothetical protein